MVLLNLGKNVVGKHVHTIDRVGSIEIYTLFIEMNLCCCGPWFNRVVDYVALQVCELYCVSVCVCVKC